MKKKTKTLKERFAKIPKIKKGEKKILLMGKFANEFDKDSRHVTQRYEVKKTISEKGKITVELTPFKNMQERRKQIIERIAKVLAEKVNNLDLMKDILEDVDISGLERLDAAIERGAEIKPKEGCFGLMIKDPRRKKPYQLMLRR